MRSNRLNYIAVGVFVLVVLAGAVTFFAVLTGGTEARVSYYTEYGNVGGLRPGTHVQFQGYKVGKVTAIEPVTDGGRVRFRVRMAVKKGFPIPRDSTATIATSSLLGGVNIEIEGGDASRRLAPGSRIKPGPSANMFQAVSSIAATVNEIGAQDIGPLIDRLTQAADALSTATQGTAPKVAKNLETVTRVLAERTPAITAALQSLTGRLNKRVLNAENAARLDASLRNLAAASDKLDNEMLSNTNLSHLQRTLSNMETFSARFAKLARDLQQTRKNVEALTTQLRAMTSNNREAVRQSVADLRHSLDAVARHIDSITSNLEGTSRNMNEFARQIRRNPSILLRGRDLPQPEP